MEANGKFLTDRSFSVNPANDAALKLFGVRYVIAKQGSGLSRQLASNANFRLVQSDKPLSAFHPEVYEYYGAQPPFGWEVANPGSSVNLRTWSAEERSFTVRSDDGGRFTLAEQFYPGWSAQVDDEIVPVERWSQAFQAVHVPPGLHRVTFNFHSQWLQPGATSSLLGLIGLAAWVWIYRRAKDTQL